MGLILDKVEKNLCGFQDGSGKENYKEHLRLLYNSSLVKNKEVFHELKDKIDDDEALQTLLSQNNIKFPHAQADMGAFIEGMDEGQAEVLFTVIEQSQ